MKWLYNLVFNHQEREFKLRLMSESILKEQNDALVCLREVIELIKDGTLRIKKDDTKVKSR